MTLASRVKQAGRIWLGHSQLATSIRPYPHAADIWRMVTRTAYVQLRFSPWLLLGTLLGMVVVYLAPPPGGAVRPWRGARGRRAGMAGHGRGIYADTAAFSASVWPGRPSCH